jgi:hypothetical protein
MAKGKHARCIMRHSYIDEFLRDKWQAIQHDSNHVMKKLAANLAAKVTIPSGNHGHNGRKTSH